ncbi:type II secretion system F family protein [Vibrio mediterranei]
MIIVTLFFILLAALLSFALTQYLASKARRFKIKNYLESNSRQSRFNFIHELLGGIGLKTQREIRNKFEEAGIYNRDSLRYYNPLKISVLIVIIVFILLLVTEPQNRIIGSIIAVVAVIVIPDTYLAWSKKRLIEKHLRLLPYLVDMTAVCVQTGMTLEAAFRYLGTELEGFDKDLCYQVRKTSDAAEVKGMEAALIELTKRVSTAQMRSFSLLLIQNMQYGTSIASILSDLAEDFRDEQLVLMEEKVGKLSAKMSAPLILFIMFPIVVLIIAPGVTRMMTGH